MNWNMDWNTRKDSFHESKILVDAFIQTIDDKMSSSHHKLKI
jgi:hypothetical protein